MRSSAPEETILGDLTWAHRYSQASAMLARDSDFSRREQARADRLKALHDAIASSEIAWLKREDEVRDDAQASP